MHTPKRHLPTLAGMVGIALTVAANNLPAQESEATPVKALRLPPTPVFAMHLDGPAAAAQFLRGTNVARLAENKELQAWWDGVWKDVKPMLQKPLQARQLDADTALANLLAFDGRLTAAVWTSSNGPDADPRGFPLSASGLVVLSPGKTTKLDALHDLLQDLIQEAPDGALQEREIAGKNLHLIKSKGGWFALPFRHGQHLVSVFGAKDAEMQTLLEDLADEQNAQRFVISGTTAKSPFSMHMNLGRFFKQMHQAAVDADDPKAARMATALQVFGVMSLDRLDMWASTENKRLLQDVSFRFKGDDLGPFASLFPEQPVQTPLAQIYPYDIHDVSAFHLNLPDLYARLRKAFASQEALGVNMQQVEEMFEAQAGVRLKEDLIDHLSGHLFMTQHGFELGLEEEDAISEKVAEASAYCYGIFLKDGPAFGAALEKALRKRGLHAARRTTKFRGHKIRTLTIAAIFKVHYVVTDRLLMVCLGKGGLTALQSVLSREQERIDGKEPQAMPKAWTERMPSIPKPHYSINQTNVAGALSSLSAQMAAIPEIDEVRRLGAAERNEPDMLLFHHMVKLFDVLPRALRQNGVDRTLASLAYRNKEMFLRSIW